ncbi:MAG: helix-turn-helix transcriptional regulator [Clostridiales bacterium]|nr:helix-turn-helix transcriptional regulator [Clostridiales bacterium]MBR6483628.1 helix-turn-helix transcriptional regulator [Clostridiales bacterium]
MKNELSTNIRAFRKERGLTQEQIAEVFGVTVGAVHKWEAGLSTPDLSLILEMADFFDTSLDVLIGFEARDNRISVLAERLRKMSYSMDPDCIAEAEKALKKYPHNFSIVFECALAYAVYGYNPGNDKHLRRAMELFKQSVTLISQNTDPDINEAVIYGQIAILHQTMGEVDKALDIYKKHNAGGMFDIKIGQILAMKGDYEQADEYLSHLLIKQFGDRINVVAGKILCYMGRKEYDEAKAVIEAAINDNAAYRNGDKPNVLDKYDCMFYTLLSSMELKLGHKKKAVECLKKAKMSAEKFDAAPDYDAKNIRFVNIKDSLVLHDTLGKTGIDAIEYALTFMKDPELERIWRSLK